ncbi:hypothetical protein DV735_g3172, partial [Chaetothyriales sp. CBS 134920]
MAPAILNYLGFGGSPTTTTAPTDNESSSVRALPGPWYTSQEILRTPGNWLRYEIAGFSIVLSRDRKGNINAFHNVCRHRAYPVVEGDSGTSKIFSCRYHGWSYALDGRLAKAPGYQDLPEFDQSQNSLFPIHVRIDTNGFIWINLDAKQTPEVPWEEDFEGADTQERLKQFSWDDYEFDHLWEIEADYNWKIGADNYNECYHCKTTHPDIPTVADLNSYSVNVQRAWIQHNGATTAEQRARGLTVCATYFWPNASMNVSPHFFFTQRFVPRGPKSTLIRYEVFRNKNSSDEDFKFIDSLYKRIMSEDKDLCDAAQKNINIGVFVNGEMHPKMEKGPLFFQNLVREAVTAHHKREQAAKTEIWPARQTLPGSAATTQKDLELCSGLACSTNQEGLAW